MNIGEKISMLKDSLGFKSYTEYGKAVDLPGDWLLQLSKKEVVTTVDVTRLIKIAGYHNISLDQLLGVNEGGENNTINLKKDLPDNDIFKMIEDIQIELKDNAKFMGYEMNKECKNIAFDSLEILKGLIKSNL